MLGRINYIYLESTNERWLQASGRVWFSSKLSRADHGQIIRHQHTVHLGKLVHYATFYFFIYFNLLFNLRLLKWSSAQQVGQWPFGNEDVEFWWWGQYVALSIWEVVHPGQLSVCTWVCVHTGVCTWLQGSQPFLWEITRYKYRGKLEAGSLCISIGKI